MPHPGTRRIRVDQYGVSLTRGNVDGICPVRLIEWDPVLGDDQLRELVQMHRMDLQTLVVVGGSDPIADLHHLWLGRWETFAVERVPDLASVVEHHRDVLSDLDVVRDRHRSNLPILLPRPRPRPALSPYQPRGGLGHRTRPCTFQQPGCQASTQWSDRR
jgi:hypothetical protein